MRKTILLGFLTVGITTYLLSSQTDAGTPVASPSIAVTPTGITINSQPLSRPVSLTQIQSLLGRPSRIKTNSPQEIAEKQQRFGVAPNNIYTYDASGILVYQKPGQPYIESISLDFRNEGLDFSPSKNFTGTLLIGGKRMTGSTSANDVRAITGMHLESSPIKQHTAKYGEHNMHFGFGRLSDPDALTNVSFEMGAPRKTNSKGWTNEDVKMMRATVIQNPQIQQLASQYHFSVDAFADCYTQKLSTQVAKDQMLALDAQAKAKVQAIIENCVLEVAKH